MAVTAPGSPYVETSDLVANYPGVSESLAERVDLVGVLPFANSTARGTALPSPTDGQYSYLQDTNATEYYNGSAWVAAGVAPGLVHINTTTFSAVSSVNLNNIFSSTYNNYLYKLNYTCSSTGQLLQFRMRASGTDATGSDYSYTRSFSYNSLSFQTNSNADSSFGVSFSAIIGTENSVILSIERPFESARTTIIGDAISQDTLGTLRWIGAATHKLSNSYDGLTFFPAAGTISGTIRVYGYKNS